MSQPHTQTQPVSFLRRYWKPAAITGAGGTAVAVWLDEIILFGEELLGLLFLPLIAGGIYLFDTYLFKSRMPRRGDLEDRNKNGAKEK